MYAYQILTIDSESTTEIDDGLSVEWLEDGRERVWVHIADPTRWLNIGDPMETVKWHMHAAHFSLPDLGVAVPVTLPSQQSQALF